jgi:hypothetical protein
MTDCPPTCLAAARFRFKTSSRDASARPFSAWVDPLPRPTTHRWYPWGGWAGGGGRCELNEKRASAEPRCPQSGPKSATWVMVAVAGPHDGDARHRPRGERVSVRPADQLRTWTRRCGQGEGAERRSLRTTVSQNDSLPVLERHPAPVPALERGSTGPHPCPGAGINGTPSLSWSGIDEEPIPVLERHRPSLDATPDFARPE